MEVFWDERFGEEFFHPKLSQEFFPPKTSGDFGVVRGGEMSSLEYALSTIKEFYQISLSSGHDTCVCQLTNENQGFTREVIESLKQQLDNLTFDLPTYISILPAGRKESTKYLFDGLEEIYCNSSDLKSFLSRIKKRKIK